MAMAFWYNTLEQAQAESIDMTIASEKVVASARSAGIITTSRMTADRSWIPTVEHLHSALYLLSPLSGAVTGEVHFVDCGYNTVSMPSLQSLKELEADSSGKPSAAAE